PIRTNPLTRQFLLDLAREVVAVGRAHGVALPADYAEQRIPFFDGWPPEMTIDAPRSATGQAARAAVALRRRGRPRCRGRRADADEPRRARHAGAPCGGQRGAQPRAGRTPKMIDGERGHAPRPSLPDASSRSCPR